MPTLLTHALPSGSIASGAELCTWNRLRRASSTFSDRGVGLPTLRPTRSESQLAATSRCFVVTCTCESPSATAGTRLAKPYTDIVVAQMLLSSAWMPERAAGRFKSNPSP